MHNTQSRHYLIIWLWLLTLVIVSIAATSMLPKVQAMVLIFAIAIFKAWLVARNYMHLKNETPITYAMLLVPLAFVVILLLALFPDFVYHR